MKFDVQNDIESVSQIPGHSYFIMCDSLVYSTHFKPILENEHDDPYQLELRS